MKKLVNRIVTGIVTLSLLASLTCHANNTQKVTSFSDVPPAYWGYQTIMDMTEYGIFKGTTTPVNGVGTFSPEKTMTRAEFITAALRAVYPDIAGSIETDKNQWWRGYYILALDKKIVKIFELDNGDLNQPMSREEMAMVMVRCVENMGEKLEKRVATSQIADYNTVDEYYKAYVRDCFSYGLLCGVDYKGTFMPAKTLTRAEAATVLCRLIDVNMRVDVEFLEEPADTDDDNRWDSYEEETDDRNDKNDKEEETEKPKKEDNKKPSDTDKKEESKRDPMPWEDGGKKPDKYTLEEYEELTAEQQAQFFEWFDSVEEFEEWKNSVSMNQDAESDDPAYENPWEKPGARQPNEYTWEEFERLTADQKEMFSEWFDSAADYKEWENHVLGSGTSAKNPWEEKGSRKPDEYTWEEFEELTAEQQEMFYEWFGSAEEFIEWQGKAQLGKLPWEEKGSRKPDEYTWEEFEELTAEQQEMFYEWFGSAEEFIEWQGKAQLGKLPWEEKGSRKPDEYTWEEFEELTAEQQEMFFEWFGSAEEFIEWQTKAQP